MKLMDRPSVTEIRRGVYETDIQKQVPKMKMPLKGISVITHSSMYQKKKKSFVFTFFLFISDISIFWALCLFIHFRDTSSIYYTLYCIYTVLYRYAVFGSGPLTVLGGVEVNSSSSSLLSSSLLSSSLLSSSFS